MKLRIFFISLLLTHFSQAQSYKKIHNSAILVDSHNDILSKVMENGYIMDSNLKGKTHSDLDRWKEGGLDVQIFSVFCDGKQVNPFGFANRQMDTLDAVIKRNPDKIAKATTTKSIQQVVKQGKIAALFGVEGGHMIENNLDNIDKIFNRGARYMTLTWNNSTDWATSAYDERYKKDLTDKGLNDFGKQVVVRMNDLGMMVDVSHIGETTFWDVMKITTKPVIASHSSVYAICDHQRNLNDDQIKAIAKNKGVIQVNFYSGFLDKDYMKRKNVFLENHKAEIEALVKSGTPDYAAEDAIFEKHSTEVASMRAPFSLLMEHIEYIIKLVGVNYVGIGSDFDGIESTPQTIDDVTTYPLITKSLVEKGYSKKEITKILGGNVMRVLKANESN